MPTYMFIWLYINIISNMYRITKEFQAEEVVAYERTSGKTKF